MQKSGVTASWSAGATAAGAPFQPASVDEAIIGVSFTAPQTTSNFMVGLSTTSTQPSNFNNINFAMHATNFGDIFIWESGTLLGRYAEDYTTGDTFQVVVVPASAGSANLVVQYRLNNVAIYTSSLAVPTRALYARAALYEPNTRIADIRFVTKQTWCEAVTCTSSNPCIDPGPCVAGECQPTFKDGAPCNDGNAVTVNDTCTQGTCEGVDPCAGVQCDPIDECHQPGTCSGGQCFAGPNVPNLTPCNDANDLTYNDVCINGVCLGATTTTTTTTTSTTTTSTTTTTTSTTDPCKDVFCPLPDQCHQPGVCSGGLCFAGSPLANGTECDDGNPDTLDDACQNGVCVGKDPCEGIVCEPLDQCFLAGVCVGGTCTTPFAPDGTQCDNNDPTDFNDRFVVCCVCVCVCVCVCLRVRLCLCVVSVSLSQSCFLLPLHSQPSTPAILRCAPTAVCKAHALATTPALASPACPCRSATLLGSASTAPAPTLQTRALPATTATSGPSTTPAAARAHVLALTPVTPFSAQPSHSATSRAPARWACALTRLPPPARRVTTAIQTRSWTRATRARVLALISVPT